MFKFHLEFGILHTPSKKCHKSRNPRQFTKFTIPLSSECKYIHELSRNISILMDLHVVSWDQIGLKQAFLVL